MANVTFYVPTRYRETIVHKLLSDAQRWGYSVDVTPQGNELKVLVTGSKRICGIALMSVRRHYEDIMSEEITARMKAEETRRHRREQFWTKVMFWKKST